MLDIASQAQQLAIEGKAVEAARLLQDAMTSGDADAAFALAHWRLSGQFIRRDLGLARACFARAAELGMVAAEPTHIALLANGAGGLTRHWDEALRRLRALRRAAPSMEQELRLLHDMRLDERGDPTTNHSYEVVRSNPKVRLYPKFLSRNECDFLIERAQPLLQPSVVVHPSTGAFIRDPIRTSEVASFPFVLESPFIHALNRRIAFATATKPGQGEPLQVLRYSPGEQYKLHSDALPNEKNQRSLTFLVYLSDDYEGGHTLFPDLDLRYRGTIGDAILFSNVDAHGTQHPASRHAGEPVTAGRKYLLSKWIRRAPLDLSGPPGRPL